jgi:hypothetical protein
MPINRDRIAQALTERGATKPCDRCGHTSFSVIDGYANIGLQDTFDRGIVLGGLGIPVAVVGCDNCGAITAHALGALGIKPEATKEGKE